MLRERAEIFLMNLRTSQVTQVTKKRGTNQFHVFARGIPITLQVFEFYGNDRLRYRVVIYRVSNNSTEESFPMVNVGNAW